MPASVLGACELTGNGRVPAAGATRRCSGALGLPALPPRTAAQASAHASLSTAQHSCLKAAAPLLAGLSGSSRRQVTTSAHQSSAARPMQADAPEAVPLRNKALVETLLALCHAAGRAEKDPEGASQALEQLGLQPTTLPSHSHIAHSHSFLMDTLSEEAEDGSGDGMALSAPPPQQGLSAEAPLPAAMAAAGDALAGMLPGLLAPAGKAASPAAPQAWYGPSSTGPAPALLPQGSALQQLQAQQSLAAYGGGRNRPGPRAGKETMTVYTLHGPKGGSSLEVKLGHGGDEEEGDSMGAAPAMLAHAGSAAAGGMQVQAQDDGGLDEGYSSANAPGVVQAQRMLGSVATGLGGAAARAVARSLAAATEQSAVAQQLLGSQGSQGSAGSTTTALAARPLVAPSTSLGRAASVAGKAAQMVAAGAAAVAAAAASRTASALSAARGMKVAAPSSTAGGATAGGSTQASALSRSSGPTSRPSPDAKRLGSPSSSARKAADSTRLSMPPATGGSRAAAGSASTWLVADAPAGTVPGAGSEPTRIIAVSSADGSHLARCVRAASSRGTASGLVAFESYALGAKVPQEAYAEATALYAALLPALSEWVAEHPRGKLAFTGVGVGGSLATLLGLMAVSRGLRAHCLLPLAVVFNAPPVLAEVVAGELWGCGSHDGSGADADACGELEWGEMVEDLRARGLLAELGLPQGAVLNVQTSSSSSSSSSMGPVTGSPATSLLSSYPSKAAAAMGAGLGSLLAAAASTPAAASMDEHASMAGSRLGVGMGSGLVQDMLARSHALLGSLGYGAPEVMRTSESSLHAEEEGNHTISDAQRMGAEQLQLFKPLGQVITYSP